MKRIKKKTVKLRTLIKLFVCILYIIVISILALCSYRLYVKADSPTSWSSVKDMNDYSYINISRMSEEFATLDNGKKQLHFVIEKTVDGKWYTYLIKINKSEEKKFRDIIDYSYGKTDKVSKNIRVSGYPKKITKQIKSLAIKYAPSFLPADNENILTEENFEEYLTNIYLDTTVKQVHQFNYIMLTLMIIMLILVIMLIITIFDRDRLVDEVDKIFEHEEKKVRKQQKKNRKKQIK